VDTITKAKGIVVLKNSIFDNISYGKNLIGIKICDNVHNKNMKSIT
jgi:hypothetical protein